MKEKATKYYLKSNEVLLEADGHELNKFDIYQGINQVLQIVLRATQTLDILVFS